MKILLCFLLSAAVGLGDQVLAKKENSRIFGRSLKYYAVRWESGSVNELSDELVDVFLDEHDRVRSVCIRVTLSDEPDR